MFVVMTMPIQRMPTTNVSFVNMFVNVVGFMLVFMNVFVNVSMLVFATVVGNVRGCIHARVRDRGCERSWPCSMGTPMPLAFLLALR